MKSYPYVFGLAFFVSTFFSLAQKNIDSIAVGGPSQIPKKKDHSVDNIDENIPPVFLNDFEDAYRYDSLWMRQMHKSRELFQQMYAEVTDTIQLLPNDIVVDLPTDTLKRRLAVLNAKTPFNVSYHPSLESVIKRFLKHKRGLVERMLTLSQFYFPMFEQELDNNGLPLELKYLSIVESALNPKAKSPVGATGLWQFMFATGKMHGLDVNSYVDERSDPIRSTKAASKYLSQLYSIFDDWDLALAAYNSGPGNVNKAIRRSGGYKNYWNIRNWLPRETAGYVPAFLATFYIFEYAEEHGLRRHKIERPYFETDTVWIKSIVTFDQISEVTGVPLEEIEMLNPSYKLNVIPKIENKNYALRLPIKHLGRFVSNEQAIYAFAQEQIDALEKPLPQVVNTESKIRYRVRSGDYLGKIAERYGVGVSQIQRWNGMRGTRLRVGQRLTIYPRKPITYTSRSKKSSGMVKNNVGPLPKDPSKIHIVKSGDSLWSIARAYPGLTIDKLKKWNGLAGNRLKPGTQLRLCNCTL